MFYCNLLVSLDLISRSNIFHVIFPAVLFFPIGSSNFLVGNNLNASPGSVFEQRVQVSDVLEPHRKLFAIMVNAFAAV